MEYTGPVAHGKKPPVARSLLWLLRWSCFARAENSFRFWLWGDRTRGKVGALAAERAYLGGALKGSMLWIKGIR